MRENWLPLAGLELLSCAVTGGLAAIAAVVLVLGPLTLSAFHGLDRMIYGAEATSELAKIPASFFVILAAGLLLSGAAASLTGVGLYRAGIAAARGRRPRARMLFPLDRFGAAVAMNLLRLLIVCLGALLLIAPGVVALYRYSMANYLLAAHPNLGPIEALRRSAKRMRCRKRDLFRLQLPFLLAMLACALPLLSARLVARSPLWVLIFALLFFAACLYIGAQLLLTAILYFQSLNSRRRKQA